MNKSGFAIFRPAQKSDLPLIELIWLEGLKRLNPSLIITDEQLTLFRVNFLAPPPFNFWVAESKTVIGWCSVLPAFSHPLKQGSNGEVSTYVNYTTENKGIGTELMKFVFSEINNTCIENVYGFADPLNKSSIKMCENAGMKICGQTSKRTILIKEYI